MDENAERKRFVTSPAEYSDEQLLIGSWQVMQAWEDLYMRELAKVATQNRGTVLELGYGMGISSRYLRESGLDRYVVIEAHPDVVRRALTDLAADIEASKAHIFQGFWEDVTPMLASGSFDGILFDTSPLDEETVFYHGHNFFAEAARLLRKGGVFTFFSDEARQLSDEHVEALKSAGFTRIEQRPFAVEPVDGCRYWTEDALVVPAAYK